MKAQIEAHLADINSAVQNITPENIDVYHVELGKLREYLKENLDFPEVDGLEIYFKRFVAIRNHYLNVYRVIGFRSRLPFKAWIDKEYKINLLFFNC
jgi:hypothetical protein